VGAGACHNYSAKRGRAGQSQSATTVMLKTSRDQAVNRVPDTKEPTVASTHRRAFFLMIEQPSDKFLPVVGPRQRPERLSRGHTSPYTTFDNFLPWRLAWHTPRRVAADASLFSCLWCRPCGRRTIHPSGSRPRDVSRASQTSAPGTCCAPENRRFPAGSQRRPLTNAMAPLRVPFSHGSRQRRRQTPQSGGGHLS